MPPRHVGYAIRDATLDDFVSSDPPMQACLERARLAARTDLPVLILGESGTGKTILARAIHNSSARAAGPFVSFNAAALSETLIDSQLFGHERGAFTGAQAHVKGKFELADRGTLFLDEVGDLSPQGQSKILRAIEYGEFERLGSDTLRQADVRVLSATHHRPAVLVRERQFREDLFYRINGVTIVVPPLRDRPQDLPVLVASEIARASQLQGKVDRRTRSRGCRLVVRLPLAGQPPGALEGGTGRRCTHERLRDFSDVPALQTDLEAETDERSRSDTPVATRQRRFACATPCTRTSVSCCATRRATSGAPPASSASVGRRSSGSCAR